MTGMALSLMRNAALRCTGIAGGFLEAYLTTNAVSYDLAFGGGRKGSLALARWNWKGVAKHPYIPRWKFLYATIPVGQCVLLMLATVTLTIVSMPLVVALYVGDIALVVCALLLQWQVLIFAALRARHMVSTITPTPYELEFVSGQTDDQVRDRSAPDSALPHWWNVHVQNILWAEHLRSLARKVVVCGCASIVIFFMCVGIF